MALLNEYIYGGLLSNRFNICKDAPNPAIQALGLLKRDLETIGQAAPQRDHGTF
jgi:hypothetical protein